MAVHWKNESKVIPVAEYRNLNDWKRDAKYKQIISGKTKKEGEK
jgi:hypothetical protein